MGFRLRNKRTGHFLFLLLKQLPPYYGMVKCGKKDYDSALSSSTHSRFTPSIRRAWTFSSLISAANMSCSPPPPYDAKGTDASTINGIINLEARLPSPASYPRTSTVAHTGDWVLHMLSTSSCAPSSASSDSHQSYHLQWPEYNHSQERSYSRG